MKTFEMETPESRPMWIFPLIMATGVSLFLFFLDEGYYSFQWMASPGNWLIFLIYTVVLFLTQVMVIRFMNFTDISKATKRVISLAGIPIGLVILFTIFSR